MDIKKLLFITIAGFFVSVVIAQPIPLDQAVRTGKLANGFTYFIRHNQEPQNQVQLYLVNKIGSVLEDEDQRGLAHFMEHMNFNGTKNFPKNDLVDYLQKSGVRFGADLNAYTTFDETVYQLPIPTDDPAMIVNGLRIMRDWAQEATLDSTEIEKERGVVLEEERLGKGARERMSRKYFPVLFNYSRYASRLPIGLDEVLIHFKPAVIRRFHHDWYRPDLQALIVVGDVDVNEVEKIIRSRFSDLKNPVNERPRPRYTIPLTGNNHFLSVTDKETPATSLEIFIKHPAPSPIRTNDDYLELMKRGIFSHMLAARRYAEISHEKTPSYVDMSAGLENLMGGLNMFTFNVTAKNGQLQNAFQQAWGIIEKIKRYGFSQAEFTRAKQTYLRSLEEGYKEKGKTPSPNFVKEYQDLFLHGNAAPGIKWEYDFVNAHINNITLDDINSVFKNYLKQTDRDIILMAPETEKSSLPDSVTVSSWIDKVSKGFLLLFKDDSISKPLMPVKPQAGKVISKNEIPALHITQLTLSNGLTVILKPTNFKNDEIRFKGFGPGGTSLYNETDFDAATNAAGLMSRFGLGDFNPLQLSHVLNGKLLNIVAGIGLRSQTITGNTSPADLETALQLAYLQFTHPRKDSTLFNNIISSSKDNLSRRYADPNNVFADTISYVLGAYNFRFAPSTPERLDKISLQKAYDIYRERFADASGFTFVFVGNFNIDSITPLLEQYLGALPSTYKKEQARDLGLHIPAGQMTKKVFKGSENKALVRLVFSGDYKYSPVNNLLLTALGNILQIKLLQHIREDEGEVYSPTVQTSYNKYPQNRFAIIVAFGCAPKNADHLVAMVQKEMETLCVQGAQADDIQKYKASYSKIIELALKDNDFWLTYLSNQYENEENVLQVLDHEKNMEQVTPASLKEAATNFLSGKNTIQFQLLPETDSVK